ncbi:MAG TPA: class I SAM-dependent rRNA methyltransferase [Kofleriaceae bacterium]|nr:class I SAM-dependent rRNA methyltransferase [Kofleriaceae bacterium]
MPTAMIDVALAIDLRRTITAGHPWVYDRALAGAARMRAGELVRLRDRRGLLAVGFADPASPIRVRVLSADPAAETGDEWAAYRAGRAAALRRADPRLDATSAVRLVHGEGDFMPGLVIDLYDTTAVVLFDGEGAAAFWTPRMPAVMDGLRGGGFDIDRAWLRERGRAGRGRNLFGPEPAPAIQVHEDGARYQVDVRWGQKTGLFLDQRDNRRHVGRLAAGRTVLNLFGYTGGFSIHAGLGGARRVVTVDSAAAAIAAAERNLSLSGLDSSAHELRAADAFDYLAAAAASGRRFDLVVCDPPSFAPRADAVGAARGAYRRLNAMAMAVVAPGGLLFTASCSSHFGRADLASAVAEAAADTGRGVLIRAQHGAAGDHPVLPAFPEGDYLAFLDCAIA